jgi:hypothetical protein
MMEQEFTTGMARIDPLDDDLFFLERAAIWMHFGILSRISGQLIRPHNFFPNIPINHGNRLPVKDHQGLHTKYIVSANLWWTGSKRCW